MPNLLNVLQQKKILLGLVVFVLISFGIVGGVYLATSKKRLTLFTKATPLTASSGIANLNSTPATQLICEQDYVMLSNIASPAGPNTDNQQIKDQRAWINYQGTNAGEYRGQFRWVYNISMVPAGQTAYPCKCGNANQCLPNAPNSIAGYIWLENDKNADLVPYIELLPLYPTMTPPRYCEAWNNYSTDPLSPGQNHVFTAKFKVKTQWAIDGPNTLNDISTFAVNLAGQSIGWVNNDANYSISCSLPTPAPSASASPGPTAIPTAAPSATPLVTPAGCNAVCENHAGCETGRFCYIQPGQTTGVCRNPACQTTGDCNCPSIPATPTPSPTTVASVIPQVPKAGNTLPTWIMLGSGILLLTLGAVII